ncbi:serine/threonine-protein phosphatase 2A regulatory subunit B'' subunit gamma-like [Drosophila serrata]|uniref:serine/threonine-protein phosphatase 2A regulatory subunit B'' subunit gamma-like n=1 Tax=Drosophila serrata TaxID=7274 RepID=UPI000A1D0ED5|nr:serine/threonine-protein phosphatase 2A regulatory subunit B'' subunit gamma-like [Drosophila serrata]
MDLEKDFEKEAPLEQQHPSYKLIPKFFNPSQQSGDQIQQIETQGIELQAKVKELLDVEELEELWETLEWHVTEITQNDKMLIDFENYLEMISVMDAKFREFINVQLFFDLMNESEFEERLEIVSIYNHTIRAIRLARARICLCYYDQLGMGYLSETDLESFIVDMKTLWSQPPLEKFYVCTVVKMVFFFLDSLHTGRVRISDIESSGMISEIMEEKHSFSKAAILEVYEKFLELDKDHNGRLSKMEMCVYGSGLLTTLFLDRVFEVCHTFNGEIDYKTFLELFLALEYRQTAAGLRYIFHILDVNQQGYITSETLRLYFYTKTHNGYQAEYTFKDLNNKIFDMVQPMDPSKITLRDLINCREGKAAVSLIIEFQKFVANKDTESAVYIKYPNSNEQPQRRDTPAVTTLSQI